MSSKTTFVIPNFDKSIKNKVNDGIKVMSPTTLSLSDGKGCYTPAISTNGIPSNSDGVYVFAMKINEAKRGDFMIGFTDKKTFDSKDFGHAGNGDIPGTSLRCYDVFVLVGSVPYLSLSITRNAKEIITIFTISNGTKEVQWIVDGNEGRVVDCTKHFGNGDQIFACVSFGEDGQQVEFISFDQVKSRSTKIEELMKEFNSKHKQQPISSAPSTSTAENDALISQLREQVARSQNAAVKDRDEMIRDLKQQLTVKDQQISARDQLHRTDLLTKDKQLQTIVESKDQQHREELRTIVESNERVVQSHRSDFEVKDKQLELERAEHQKTRNLLHQIKMELKDMEIYYLKKEKESGQRRQREEENDPFKVKQEPGIEEDEKESKKKTVNKKN